MATPTMQTIREAVLDHQTLAGATAGVISNHASAALVTPPLTLVCANVSPTVTNRTLLRDFDAVTEVNEAASEVASVT
jgi:hypothetical protein